MFYNKIARKTKKITTFVLLLIILIHKQLLKRQNKERKYV
jgi:hypothetical protein